MLPLQNHNTPFQLLDPPHGFTRSDDANWQKELKAIFCEFLPGPRTFAGDDFWQLSTMPRLVHTGFGQEQTVSRSMKTSAAVLRRYVRWRGKSKFAARLIPIDVDAVRCWDKWREWGMPEPTITVINPTSGHHQWLYLLEDWCFDEADYMRV